jgi:DivIVA domain-containing protein
MALTPDDVRAKRFACTRLREGYDMGEVDDFLDEVEAGAQPAPKRPGHADRPCARRHGTAAGLGGGEVV